MTKAGAVCFKCATKSQKVLPMVPSPSRKMLWSIWDIVWPSLGESNFDTFLQEEPHISMKLSFGTGHILEWTQHLALPM